MGRLPSNQKNSQPPKQRTTRKKGTDAAHPSRRPLNEETDDFIFSVCERFFEHLQGNAAGRPENTRHKGPASSVAEWLKEQGRPDLNREKIYPLVWEAFKRKFLLLQAPVEKDLRLKLIEHFALDSYLKKVHGDITVVNVTGPTSSQHVSSTVADSLINMIYEVDKEKKEKAVREGKDPNKVRVHLGLGAGYAAMELVKRLSTRAKAQIPKLTLHAISPGGFYVEAPQWDPMSYFTYFDDKAIDVEVIGFFAPPVIDSASYDKLRSNPSLTRAFSSRKDIDILVTSLASADDEHGLLHRYFDYLKNEKYIEENATQTLTNKKWVGDLLFQPYSAKQAINAETIRPVALFNYEELLEFSMQTSADGVGKRVVLIGAPCKDCAKPKTNALRPLLTEPSLRVWTHLTIDRSAALQLLEEKNA